MRFGIVVCFWVWEAACVETLTALFKPYRLRDNRKPWRVAGSTAAEDSNRLANAKIDANSCLFIYFIPHIKNILIKIVFFNIFH